MDYFNNNTTPTSAKTNLGTDTNENPAQYQYRRKYGSVIVILMYVTSNSRPDIAFAVHQCVRSTHKFKHSHEKEFWRVFKYLQGTRKDGKL